MTLGVAPGARVGTGVRDALGDVVGVRDGDGMTRGACDAEAEGGAPETTGGGGMLELAEGV